MRRAVLLLLLVVGVFHAGHATAAAPESWPPLEEALSGPLVDPTSKAFRQGCLMPKSGLSLVQVEQVLLAFPMVCSDIYPDRKSLPVVIEALQKFWGQRFPRKFIYAPCGTLFPRLVDVGEYLKDPKKADRRH